MNTENKSKVSKKLLFAWPTATISTGVAAAFLGYITFFATDYLGISAVTAGMVFMVSKIFDGITDLIAGYLIDRTNTKMGKGRPYDLTIIGYWLTIVAMFAAPKMGMSASVIYLFVMYTLCNSVFLTLWSCGNTVYLANALEKPEHSVTVLSFNGIVTMVFSMIAAIAMPQIVSIFCQTRTDWAIVSVVLAIPCTLVGLIRFFVVKERKDITSARAVAEKITVKDMVSLLAHNKYVLMFAVVLLFANIGTAASQAVGTYFALYVLGDVGFGSILSMTMLSAIIGMIVTPAIAKKVGFTNIMRACALLGVAGNLLRLFAIRNLLVLFLTGLLAALGPYMIYMYANTFLIDCMDYGEWKNGVRSEGTLACVSGFTSKIGTAVGAGLTSILMGIAGYVGTQTVQPDSAITMIIMLYSVVPAIFCLVEFIFLRKYDLENRIREIRAELEAKRGAADNRI